MRRWGRGCHLVASVESTERRAPAGTMFRECVCTRLVPRPCGRSGLGWGEQLQGCLRGGAERARKTAVGAQAAEREAGRSRRVSQVSAKALRFLLSEKGTSGGF